MKFGRYTVLGPALDGRPGYWHCRCECGTERDVCGSSLKTGSTKSCGCYAADMARKNHTTHGKYGIRLHRIWSGMKQRVYYGKNISHQWYEDKDIAICDDWLSDFQNFYDWAMANGYRDDLTIDRIDNTKGYSPENCRWATPKEQANNRSTNLRYTYDGIELTLKQWAERLGINYHTLYCRIRVHGHPFEEAINM